MRKYILLLLLIPLINLAQEEYTYKQVMKRTFTISGSSSQENGQTLIPLLDGDFISAKVEGRSSSISLGLRQEFKFIGVFAVDLSASYHFGTLTYDFSNPEYNNYEEVEEMIVPHLGLQYSVLNTNFFTVYASIGAHAYLASLGYTYVNDLLEPYDYNYNLLIPYFGAGAILAVGNGWRVRPFINYQIDPIYFDDFSEIEPADLESAFDNAGLVTGVVFEIQINQYRYRRTR
tara:strand:- start:3389 stop:4084 length:696 start_codon:yes stop_codon:yes gene_type:complete